MARKKHAEEHENLERWLVSYADFITLLFATFVVLYALSQMDMKKFEEMSVSMKKAFASPSVMQGDQGIMPGSGLNILGGMDNESNMISPLFENTEAKAEENAFKQTKESVEKLAESNENLGIDSYVSERGLVVSLAENLFFASGSAEIKPSAYKALSKISILLKNKFSDHPIRVEGHTDNMPIKSSIYPSNWELSSARAASVVRFILSNSKFDKNRFAALGYADGRPIADNNTAIGRNKNRRVEIVVLRNKLAKSESKISGMNKERIDRIKDLEQKQNKQLQQYQNVSDAAKKLVRQSGESVQDVMLLNDSYEKQSERLAKELKAKEDQKKKELKLPDIKLKKPANLTKEQKVQIETARKKGLINDAVAELMKQRGDNKDVVIIKQKQ
ncbi:MAG: OmpA family protein [Candidatus Gastranaerophilales bacterium]|nr:OmpA family protein [Candidatus Gastranaerophilales bacterium]